MILITLVYLDDRGLAVSSTVPVANIREVLYESPKTWIAYIHLPSMATLAEFVLNYEDLVAGVTTEAQARALGIARGVTAEVPLDAGADVWSWLEAAKVVRCKLRCGKAGTAPGKLEDLLPRPSIPIR